MEQQFTDYIIETNNPEALDKIINAYGGILQQDYNGNYIKSNDGCYNMRIIGNPGYIEFMIKNQGYGKIIQKL